MVPTIIGGQSCESCNAATEKFGPPQHPDTVTTAELTAALIAEGFSGVGGSGVGPTELLTWYKERIAAEGNWRTFARILSDSGHACSSALHAQALAAHAPSGTIWRYFFGYVAPMAGGGSCRARRTAATKLGSSAPRARRRERSSSQATWRAGGRVLRRAAIQTRTPSRAPCDGLRIPLRRMQPCSSASSMTPRRVSTRQQTLSELSARIGRNLWGTEVGARGVEFGCARIVWNTNVNIS